MSLVNYHTKEINCKIVYYGPGLGGKTTNMQQVYNSTHIDSDVNDSGVNTGEKKGELISIDTDNERTLFFDFLPLELGEIKGFKTRFHLYTVPGQVFYESSRKLILRHVDGVIFVADSQVERMESNIESLQSLKINLEDQGADIQKVPIVFQWNKRDLPNVIPQEELSKKLNPYDYPEFCAQAIHGLGVMETLKQMSKMVLANIKGGMNK